MIGEIKLIPEKATIPDKWLLCDGKAVPGKYYSLRKLIGTTLPKPEQMHIKGHLEPEGNGYHEKVIVQASVTGLPEVPGFQYIIQAES